MHQKSERMIMPEWRDCTGFRISVRASSNPSQATCLQTSANP